MLTARPHAYATPQHMPGEHCAWCDQPITVTASFEDCPHATGCCAEHFSEYFEYVGWEDLLTERSPECPDCAG